MKKEKEKHRVSFLDKFKANSVDIYLSQELKIPAIIIAGFDAVGSSQAKIHNRQHPNNAEITLTAGDDIVKAFIANDFISKSITYQPDPDGAEITSEDMEERLNTVGQTEALETYISTCNSREATATSRYDTQTKNLMHLFTTIIGSVTSEIMTLVNNFEFAKAWTQLIHYWVVHRDETHIILQLELNVLTCTYNTAKHNDFSEYFNAIHNHYSLLLYKQWHEHFSFEQIKEMCDVMTDYGIRTQHEAKLTEKGLIIPEILREQRRVIQVLAGVKGSHLHEAQQLFQTLNLELMVNQNVRMVDLKRHLTKAESENTNVRKSATLQYITKGSTNPTSAEDKCGMCLFLKDEQTFTNIKGHLTGVPCPPGNMAIMQKWFTTNPHISGKAQGKAQKGGWSKPPTYGDSRGNNPNVMPTGVRSQPPLQAPEGFNHAAQCIHCWRSMKHGGRDSYYRGREWENHGSANCSVKNNPNNNPPYQAHTSQLVAPANQQRDDGYAQNRDNRGRSRQRDDRDRGPIGGYAANATSDQRSRSRSRSETRSHTPPYNHKVTRLDSPQRDRDRDRNLREYSQERRDRDDDRYR
jgi:hypothetical protein